MGPWSFPGAKVNNQHEGRLVRQCPGKNKQTVLAIVGQKAIAEDEIITFRR